MSYELKLIKDTMFTVDNIDKFIPKTPGTIFESIKTWEENFLNYLKRLYDPNFIAVFTDNFGELKGFFCWCLVDKKDEQKINKITWTLPENITNGNSLYVGICYLNKGCSMLDVKKFLKNKIENSDVKEVFWFTKKGWFRANIRSPRRGKCS